MFDIAITIVNYKTTEEIRQLLESIKKDLAESALKVQTVIVDNSPEDGAWLVLKNNFPEAQYLSQDYNLGFGRAQNVGLRSTEAKYYFILNPDTILLEGERILARLFEFMENRPKIGMIGPQLLNTDGSLQFSCFRFPLFWIPLYRRSALGQWRRNKKKVENYAMKDFNHKKTQPVDWLMGSAIFVRAAALQEVGLFDERFWMYFEDCDLCRRFWTAHWPVYYIHEIKIIHHYGRGSAKISGLLRSILKNPFTRLHIISWLKYMWKWRGERI